MGGNHKVWGSFENASSAMARRVVAVGIDSTDKLPLQDSQRIKLGRTEPHHKFWTPSNSEQATSKRQWTPNRQLRTRLKVPS